MLDLAAKPRAKRDLRLPRLHASMHRGEIRLQILRYRTMHHKDGFLFFFCPRVVASGVLFPFAVKLTATDHTCCVHNGDFEKKKHRKQLRTKATF